MKLSVMVFNSASLVTLIVLSLNDIVSITILILNFTFHWIAKTTSHEPYSEKNFLSNSPVIPTFFIST